MIKIIMGGIGSGKSLTCIKQIIKRRQFCFCNFPLNKYKNYRRLEIGQIIKNISVPNENGKLIIKQIVNWDFWLDMVKNGVSFDIYIDEAHNIINSRRGMSKFAFLFQQWTSQIRKLLGESEKNHLFFITQRLTSIDLFARELAREVIYCRKFELENKKIVIVNYTFEGEECLAKLLYFLDTGETRRVCKSITAWYGNPYFNIYDSYGVLKFDEMYV